MQIEIPKDHPRRESLLLRERIIEGYESSVVAGAGVVAHGRGEAFDYLLGEQTPECTKGAIGAAAAAFLIAGRPVISVNGNVAALCPEALVELSRTTGAPLEVNLFYRTEERERAIERVLRHAGATEVLGVGDAASGRIPELGSERRRVDPRGIAAADLVFVPLEDGDRTEALVRMGKRVITVDLNPLSRTARRASITIVDNIIRVLPALVDAARAMHGLERAELEAVVGGYDNGATLGRCLDFIADRLKALANDAEE